MGTPSREGARRPAAGANAKADLQRRWPLGEPSDSSSRKRDLLVALGFVALGVAGCALTFALVERLVLIALALGGLVRIAQTSEIGRASCRERVSKQV